MVTCFHSSMRVYNTGCRRDKDMNTLLMVVLVALVIAVITYLSNVLPDMGGNAKGKCSSADYELADKIAQRKNN